MQGYRKTGNVITSPHVPTYSNKQSSHTRTHAQERKSSLDFSKALVMTESASSI